MININVFNKDERIFGYISDVIPRVGEFIVCKNRQTQYKVTYVFHGIEDDIEKQIVVQVEKFDD